MSAMSGKVNKPKNLAKLKGLSRNTRVMMHPEAVSPRTAAALYDKTTGWLQDHLNAFTESNGARGLRHYKQRGRMGRKGACFIYLDDLEAYMKEVLVENTHKNRDLECQEDA